MLIGDGMAGRTIPWALQKYFRMLKRSLRTKNSGKDPISAYVIGDLPDIVDCFRKIEYNVDVYRLPLDDSMFYEILFGGKDGRIVEQYRGEDITIAKSYQEEDGGEIADKRVHARFWKYGEIGGKEVYMMSAHTEHDVNNPIKHLTVPPDFDEGKKLVSEVLAARGFELMDDLQPRSLDEEKSFFEGLLEDVFD